MAICIKNPDILPSASGEPDKQTHVRFIEDYDSRSVIPFSSNIQDENGIHNHMILLSPKQTTLP